MKSSRIALIVQILLISGLLILCTFVGNRVRYQSWQRTEALRYKPDMENAWKWGSRAAKEGYFQLYHSVIESQKENKEKKYELDYVPLRLAVMTIWAKSRIAVDPGIDEWKSDYAFNAPLLRFNTFMELVTAAGIFMLVRQWSRRDDNRQSFHRKWLRAEWLALIAFGLVWFNPASLLSAHARPTWDVWVTPFFIWAIWLCACNWWLTTGILLAIGTMFKGQELIVAPLFLLWPLMGLKIGPAARFLLGYLLTAAIIVSPWIIGLHWKPILFVITIALLPIAIYITLKYKPIKGLSFPPRWLRWLIPIAITSAMIACVPIFKGSMDWYQIGFVYGADKFKGLEAGGASSLAGILSVTYHWSYTDPLFVIPYTSHTVTISQAMIACYAICMMLIAWSMRRYERAGDKRFLLAMSAIWIVYFAIFPKMHERYLLWGALCACSTVAVGMGHMMLAIFFSLCSTIMSLYQMLPRNQANDFLPELGSQFGTRLYNFVHPTFPHLGWAIVMGASVWMWLVLAGAISCKKPAQSISPVLHSIDPPDQSSHSTGL